MKNTSNCDISIELDMMELYISTLTIDGQSEELKSLGEEAIMKLGTLKSKIPAQNYINEVVIILNERKLFLNY